MKYKIISKSMVAILALSFLVTSCMTTKTPVGQYHDQEGKEVTYDKSKQFYMFWGLIRLGHTHTLTPQSGDCMVVTRANFGDGLITLFTGGIICSQTIKVKVKEPKVETSKE